MTAATPAKPAPKPPTRRLIIATYAGAALLFVGGVAAPAALRIRALRAEIAAKKLALADANAQQRQLTRMKLAVAALRARLANDRTLVPHRLRRGRFLRALDRTRAHAGFAVSTVRTGSSKRLRHCDTLPIDIRGSGTSAALCRFLRGVEALPRKCWITNLSINANPAMRGTVMVNMQCSLYASTR